MFLIGEIITPETDDGTFLGYKDLKQIFKAGDVLDPLRPKKKKTFQIVFEGDR